MLKLLAEENKALEHLGNVELAQSRHHFIAAECFQKGKAGIVSISLSFDKWFCHMQEDPHCRTTIRSFKLPECTSDIELCYLLGKERRCATKLRHIFILLGGQSDGREGFLAVDGSWNYFYAVDPDFEYRKVSVQYKSGWHIEAGSFARSECWSSIGRVFA